MNSEILPKLKLIPGQFYKSRDGHTWCCFKVRKGVPEHATAFCVRVLDDRIEYFYPDGRYDREGKREHTLVELIEGSQDADQN